MCFDAEGVEALAGEIATLCGHMHAAEFRLLKLIRALEAKEPWGNLGVASCAHWLNWRCGIDLGAAREKVRVAHALPELPAIAAAFRDGKLSYSKVRAITRVATPDSEADFVEIALSATAAHVEKIVRKYRLATRLETANLAFDAYRERSFSCYTAEDGALVFEGRLAPEQGAVLLKALEHAGDWVYRQQTEPSEDLPRSARQADALIALAERYLAQPPHADEGLNTADRYQVTVHVSAETLREDGNVDREDPPMVEDGVVLAAETVRRIACDVAVVPIRETGAGEPLNIGRKTRTIPPALRRALKRRDGGCRFPGCVNTRFVDGHHIRHWADGGETKLDNLILLCRHHHRLVHEGGYRVATECDRVVFRDANGSIVPRAHDVVLAGDVTVLFDAQNAFGIDEWTTTPNWDGHRPDYDHIIGVLCASTN